MNGRKKGFSGETRYKIFIYLVLITLAGIIIVPVAKPSIITIVLFNFLSFWNEYIISMTLMSSTKGPKTLPVVNNTYEPQSTTVYKGGGSSFPLELAPNEIKWYEIEAQATMHGA